jgi:hypothetical protein
MPAPTTREDGPTVFHPSVYAAEEMEARGWDRDRLAYEMTVPYDEKAWGLNRLALDFFFEVGPTDRNCRMGEIADALDLAFNVTSGFFQNIEDMWLKGSIR